MTGSNFKGGKAYTSGTFTGVQSELNIRNKPKTM